MDQEAVHEDAHEVGGLGAVPEEAPVVVSPGLQAGGELLGLSWTAQLENALDSRGERYGF